MNEQQSKIQRALETLKFDYMLEHGEITQNQLQIEMARRASNLPESERITEFVRNVQNTIK